MTLSELATIAMELEGIRVIEPPRFSLNEGGCLVVKAGCFDMSQCEEEPDMRRLYRKIINTFFRQEM